ncbi:PAS domain S-box protein [Niveibacterium sp. SC-1]|uniref:PAS domain-containing sensor histidine kinase n=1 Tax=Niveibacterium sp. SC-1 TaxID=3135646 RepID=UPI00311E65BB
MDLPSGHLLLTFGALGVAGVLALRLRALSARLTSTRATAERVLLLSDLASDWTWEQDAELRFTSLSGGAIERGRVPLEQVLGRTRWEIEGLLCEPERLAAHREDLEARRPFRDFEYGIRGADGRVRWFVTSGAPILQGERFLGYFGCARDDTRRQAAERELRESQHRLREVVDANPVAMLGIDRERRVFLWNTAAERLLGIPRDAMLKRGDYWRAFYPEPRPLIADRVLDAAGSPELESTDFSAEAYFPDINGRPRWLHGAAVLLRDSAGEVVGAVETVQDISRLRAREADLRAQHSNLAEAQQLAGLGSAHWTVGANDVDCSPQLLSLLERGGEDRDGSVRLASALGALTPPTRRALRERWRRLQREGSGSFELSCRTTQRNGRVRHLQVRGRLEAASEDTPATLRLTAADVSALESARLYATEARRTFELLFENNPLPLILSELETGVIVKVNRAWQETFGYTTEEVVGQAAGDLGLWENPGQRAMLVNALRHQDRVSRVELKQVRRDGRHLLCELSGCKLLMEGHVLFVGCLVDITDQRRIQRAADTLNSELEARVQAHTEELRAKHQALEQAMNTLVSAEKLAALGGLVAGVTHELASPLGNALTLASSLREQAQSFRTQVEGGGIRRTELTQFFDNLMETAALIERSAGRASELMLNFKQVAADQSGEKRRRFDLADVIHGAIATLRPRLSRVPHPLHIDVPRGVMMDSYPGPLEQVLTNFVNNALLHAFEGRAEGHMNLVVSVPREGWIQLVFEDDGKGMAPEVAAQASQPFFTTQAGRGGTGLGLYIIKSLASDPLGGQLRWESTPGAGCRFILDIPIVAPLPQERAA